MIRETAARTLDDAAAPLFSVGQVSDMLGVQQAFLRRLDTQDLVVPERSDGQQRRYSRRNIELIEAIVGLIDEGLTLPGVKRVLALQAEVRGLQAQISRLRAQAKS